MDTKVSPTETLKVIDGLLQSLNREHADRPFDLAARLAMILECLHTIFPGSSCSLIPSTDCPFELLQPIVRGEDAFAIPEMLIREAGVRKGMTLSSDVPPSLHLPETSMIVACPLQVENQLLGTLIVDLHTSNPLREVERQIISIHQQLLIKELASEMREIEYQVDLRQKEEAVIQMRKVGMVISSRMELQETLESILNMAMEVTCARYGIFRLTDRTGKHLLTQAFAGKDLSNPITESLEVGGNTIMGWVAAHREPLCIQDLRKPPWNSLYYPLDVMIEMRSELAVPLIGASGRLEGVLNLESSEVGGFSDLDSYLLQSLAAQAVIAIQEAKLLDALRDIARNLMIQPTLQALDQITEHANELLNSDSCAIWLVQSDHLLLQTVSGLETDTKIIPLFDSVPGKSALSRTIEIGISDAENNQSGVVPQSKYVAVPLLAEDERTAAGAMVVTYLMKEGNRSEISDWDIKVLQNLAQFASLAIRNARKQEELQSAQERQALAETFAMVGDVTSNVLHQLNNKLGTIPVRVQGIRYKRGELIQSDAYLQKNLAEIEISANEAMESVRLNLDNLRPIELTAVGVDESAQMAIKAIKKPEEIQISMIGLEGLPPVRSGSRSLALIFENLIENAIEAMQGKGKIIIQGERNGKYIQISIRDTGPGIPLLEQPQIFDSDYSRRGGYSANRLGFGLWWVRTLLLRQGGSIRVESDGQSGSTFHLTLPVYQDGSG